ncbi:MAG: ABC transporter substrate-binding protein [Gemmatimonadaceae bacterium]|nr:ABC transporter substrate-binding protein [Acetobacteraceae bacterium]
MRLFFVLCVAILATGPARAAEAIRIGLLQTLSPAPLYIAMERGYFRDEGLDATFSFFQAAQPIAAAAVSGDIDVGITALTGGFFSLAGRGTLKVIGGGLHEQKGYEGTAILASRRAYDAGLTSMAKLGGHSLGITQFGSSFHYMAGRIAEHEGFDLKTVTLRPLQQIGNMVAAVRTGQVDATMAIASMAKPLEASGEARIIGWAGDTVPYQITAVFAPSRMLLGRPDSLHRFARAYRRGVADYRDAFLRLDAAGKPVRDERSAAVIPLLQKYVYTGDPDGPRKISEGVGYYDKDARLDVADVGAQLRWFTEQGLVKQQIDPADVIDTRFIGALPAP